MLQSLKKKKTSEFFVTQKVKTCIAIDEEVIEIEQDSQCIYASLVYAEGGFQVGEKGIDYSTDSIGLFIHNGIWEQNINISHHTQKQNLDR